MNQSLYESQTHADHKSPIIFHYDTMINGDNFIPHFHEGVEILLFTQGRANVCVGDVQIIANADDIVIINSGDIHTVSAISPVANYYCLIIDKDFCEHFDIYVEKIAFQNIIQDKCAIDKFNIITSELHNKEIYYKAAVKSAAIMLMTYFCRNYAMDNSALKTSRQSNKIDMVKKTIKYIQSNFNKNISVDHLASVACFSKYYFCHVFKEMTGFTVVFYMNFLRCKNAQSLLESGSYNVSEVAQMCGFENLSYFTKTYKKHMGTTPSAIKK